MATSIVYPSQTGSVTDYSIPFDYLSQDHVKVTLDGVATTSFSFLSTSMIRMDSAPTGDLRIYRQTPTDTSLVTWTDGSILLDDDLNLGNLQTLYVAEELEDNTVNKTASGNWDADNLKIENVADGVADSDAVNKGQMDAHGATVATSEANAAASASTASTKAAEAATSASEAAASAAAAAAI